MGGNVIDWTETPDTPIAGNPPLPTRTGRGGDFSNSGILMSSPSGFALALNMEAEAANVGFRVAAVLCDGDFDGDNDVDGADAGQFEACFTGPRGGLSAACAPGDFDDDGDIDCEDWDQFLEAWSELGDPPALAACNPADVNGDGSVNVEDLLIVLGAWGPCPAPCPPSCAADVDGDCDVGVIDLLAVLGGWS